MPVPKKLSYLKPKTESIQVEIFFLREILGKKAVLKPLDLLSQSCSFASIIWIVLKLENNVIAVFHYSLDMSLRNIHALEFAIEFKICVDVLVRK